MNFYFNYFDFVSQQKLSKYLTGINQKVYYQNHYNFSLLSVATIGSSFACASIETRNENCFFKTTKAKHSLLSGYKV